MTSGVTTQNERVILLIHGTFANPAYSDKDLPRWWRVAEPGEPETMADRLERATGAVWRPGDPRDRGMTYEYLVEWTGYNTHKARLEAAEHLAEAVGNLADGRLQGQPPGAKLRVDFVAHSHGGNVVLEALDQLPDNVEIGEVTMLGTPLLWRTFAPRLLTLATIGLLLLFLFGFLVGAFDNSDQEFGTVENIVLSIIVLMLFLPPVLWIGAWITSGWQKIGLRGGRPAYGPRPERLEALVQGRPPVLFITDEDEADLMLHLGAAPVDVYKSLVRGQPRLKDGAPLFLRPIAAILRLLERSIVRPFAYAVFVPILEIFLERFALGFPLRSVLFHNYETVTWGGRNRYNPRQIVRHPVGTDELRRPPLEITLRQPKLEPPVPGSPPGAHEEFRIERLRTTLTSALGGLRSQIQLRHSGYYESPALLADVASQLADQPIDLTETPPAPAKTIRF